MIEATTGFEPVMRVLQTLALPLGHVAINEQYYKRRVSLCQIPEFENKKMPLGIFEERATGLEPVNLFLGKEAFYQLNYARKRIRLYVILAYCQPSS